MGKNYKYDFCKHRTKQNTRLSLKPNSNLEAVQERVRDSEEGKGVETARGISSFNS